MKPATKIIEKKRMQWEPWCISKKHKSPKQKGEKYTLPKLNSKKSSPIKIQLNKVLKHEAGNEKTSCPIKQVAFPKENLANLKTKNKNEIIKKPSHINIHNEKRLKKSPSYMVFSRKFSKYNASVQQKLKAEFKSNFKSSGKFDKQCNKYKAYIKKNRNENNKSLLKYSICSSGFKEKVKKKKRTVLCSDLPGKGTYNHRFAYDEALQLNKQGIDVDVMYKVKNKTDSIYVINGEFLRTKNALRTSKLKKLNTQVHKAKSVTVTDNISEVQNPIYEQSGFEEMTKLKKNYLQKQKLTRIGSTQKARAETRKERINEELNIKRELTELQERLKAEKRINKLMRKILNQKKLLKKSIDKKPCLNEKLEEMNVDDVNIQAAERLWRLKIQQNLTANCKKYMNVIDKKPVINSVNGIEELEAITDLNVINDIERWVLRDDCNVHTMSWLKIVTRRVDSLDERVDTLYKNKWMRMAIDKVVDVMTGKKLLSDFSKQDFSNQKLMCRKTVKVSSYSFVGKTRRAMRRFHRLLKLPQNPCGVRKSPKFFGCSGGGGNP